MTTSNLKGIDTLTTTLDELRNVADIGAIANARMEFGGFVGGPPPVGTIVFRHLATEAADFAADLAESVGHLGTATSSQTDLDVRVNNVSKATIRFAAATQAATFPTAASFSLVTGDQLDIITPFSMNSGQDLSFTLVATKA